MLRQLASSYGVQTSYIGVDGRRVESDTDCVIAVLRMLGAHVERAVDAGDALRARRRELITRVLPPVVALWDDGPDGVRMTLPAARGSRGIDASLHLEGGEERSWSPSARTVLRAREVEGETFLTARLPLPSLPHGYHRLTVSVDGAHHETLVVRAPTRSFRDPDKPKRWGLFAPLYALHARRSDGIGNFSDLAELMTWTRRHRGAFVATLPFLASFPDEPSPYSPVSRLFWNELFIDTGASGSTPSRRLDYEALHASHRALLAGVGVDDDALAAFRERFPLALDYARFRAAEAHYRSPWRHWPEPHNMGVLEAEDVAAGAVDFHLRAQCLAEQQIAALAEHETELYLDLPLGVHRHGYDTWREQTLFAHDVAVGAPPDAAFPAGQNWSTPPVLPHKSREQGHRYLRLAYRHAMRHADLLRIDHVMGLHRQFWIPEGADVADGVYVRYPAEELYAIADVESHRARCELIGENLGLVPDAVNDALRRHGLRGLHISQLTPNVPIPSECVASFNTHDTEPFAAVAGGDEAALESALESLMASAADLVSVALEDLWLEPEPVNVPGTTDERPNWRRPLRYPLEALDERIGALVDTFHR